MSIIEFNYQGLNTLIQCNEKDKMKTIFEHFITKTQLEKEKVYFIYGGGTINNYELTFEETINKTDKDKNKMIIQVELNEPKEKEGKNLVQSKEIICPECKENCFLNIENYKISLNGCKNKHKINNIFLNKFQNTQFTDEYKILCEDCKDTNKGRAYENKFYICNSCNKNICPLCKSKHHGMKHNIISFEEKNYKCNIHNSNYNFYCENCKKDICNQCLKDHNNHKTLILANLIPNNEEFKNNELNQYIDTLKKDIKKINEILENTLQNIEEYYKIYNNITKIVKLIYII